MVRTVALPAGGLVEVQNGNGDVALYRIDGTEIRVVADREARSGSRERAAKILRALEIRTERTAGGVKISVAEPEAGGSWLGLWSRDEGGHADLKVGVPAVARVQLYARNGDILIESSSHSATVKTTNGDILIREVGEELLEASSVNGDIVIRLDSLPGTSRLDASSVNGDVKVVVPASLRAAIDARTVNGCVASTVSLADSRKSRSHIVGVVNGGGGQIRIRTTNGQVWVKGE